MISIHIIIIIIIIKKQFFGCFEIMVLNVEFQ